VFTQVALALVLTLAWVFSDRLGSGASLWMLFLYSFPAEFIVAVVPHEIPLIQLASRHDPFVLALVAGFGTVLTEVLNYRVVAYLATTSRVRRGLWSRPGRRVTALFARAPFLVLSMAGATPVIPFFPLRFLAVATGYPRWRYLLAGAVSRTPRFYLTALLGRALRIPGPVVLVLCVGLCAVVVRAGAERPLGPVGGEDGERKWDRKGN
jgi:membrane protein YqaA with SNARE-associated domain